MKAHFSRIFPLFFAITSGVAITMGGCGLENALVGGACAEGYAACGERCVDLHSDVAHCGACDRSCGAGVACVSGTCGGSTATNGGDGGAGLNDGSSQSSDDGAADDGSDGSSSDGSFADGAPILDGSLGDGSTGISSGDSGTSIGCTPPLVACGLLCIDVMGDDAENCGACGKTCPSGICAAGVCQGATPGDVVVIGHDFSGNTPSTSQARVLTNAVFLPTTRPLRVLSFEEFADTGAVSNVKGWIAARATASSRVVSTTVSTHDSDLASASLSQSYDVIIVYDQGASDVATASNMGASWSSSLVSFAKAGGVIVVLDGAEGNEVMPTLLESATLLDLASHTLVSTPPSHVVISSSADDVAVKVISPYAAGTRTVSFVSNEAESSQVSFVARLGDDPSSGAPVVIHKTLE